MAAAAVLAPYEEQALDEFERAVLEHARPPRRLSLAAWADEHFVLPAGDANAGKWHCIPYQRAILDAMSDPTIERVTWAKSARIGYTKCVCIAICYHIAHDPAPILAVQPTLDEAEKFSKEDIQPMLRDVPALRGLVGDPKAKDSSATLLDKSFPGGSLSIVGANSPRGFRRTSRRIIIFDEVDGYPPSAGPEGDQIELGIRRSDYYYNRKIFAGSTPTIAGVSRIERMFAEGDQRRYYVPCPVCGAMQVLKFSNLKWPPGRPEDAHFICAERGCVIEHRHKRRMVEQGEWRAERPEHFTPYNRHASFHLWAAYSYSPNASWPQLAIEFLKANAAGPTTLKTYVNTVLGETWRESGEAPDWQRLYNRRERYPIGTVPAGGLLLTAGVDVQKDRLVSLVVAWGRGKTSWIVDHGILHGDTADLDDGPWDQLDALVARGFPAASGVTMPIRMLAIDSGYATSTVYSWARRYSFQNVIAVKGQETGGVLIGRASQVDVTERGRVLKRGYRVWPVVPGIAKSELYGHLRLTDPAALGFVHFPELPESFFEEMTAEMLVTTTNRHGFARLQWQLIPGRANEALDAYSYARAAATLVGLDRFTETDWTALELAAGIDPEAAPRGPALMNQPPPAPTPPPPSPNRPAPSREQWLPRRRGWLR